MNKLTLSFLVMVITIITSFSQNFQMTLGKPGSSIYCYDGEQTNDGGYIATGIVFLGSNSDILVVKTDASGDTLWTKIYSGPDQEQAVKIKETADNGFILLGKTRSWGQGSFDNFLVRLNSTGDTLWTKTIGFSGIEYPTDIEPTSDGGYVMLSYYSGSNNVYVTKLASNGDVEWVKSYGGTSTDRAYDIDQTSDGGYVFVGYTDSYGQGGSDMLVVKIDANGIVEWDRAYGGTEDEVGYAIVQTIDGDYFAVGSCNSFGQGNEDFYIIRIWTTGTLVTDRVIGTDKLERAYDVTQDVSGDIVAVGYTNDLSGHYNMIATKFTSNMTHQWTRIYGGTDEETGKFISPTTDGGVIIGGYSQSFNPENSQDDMYLVKTDSDGLSEVCLQEMIYYPIVNPPVMNVACGVGTATGSAISSAASPVITSSNEFVHQLNGCEQNKFQRNYFYDDHSTKITSVKQTIDNGYALAGSAYQLSADKQYMTLMKTDIEGEVLWTKTYEEQAHTFINDMQITSDGGYILGGMTSDWEDSEYFFYVVRTNSAGDVIWTKKVGGPGLNEEFLYGIQETNDGGFVLAGATYSYGAGMADNFIVKLDEDGNTTWANAYGGTSSDFINDIYVNQDGSFIATGYTTSYGAGNNDVFLMKINSNGSLAWTKTYGGTIAEDGESVIQTNDGGYIITGSTSSYGEGGNDVLVIKTDMNGNLQWSRAYGTTGHETGATITQQDQYYIIGGGISGAIGGNDGAILKIDLSGNLLWAKAYGGDDYDVNYRLSIVRDGGYVFGGATNSFDQSSIGDSYLVKTDVDGNTGDCHELDLTYATAVITPTVNAVSMSLNSGYTDYGSSVISSNVTFESRDLIIDAELLGTNVNCFGGSDGAVDITIDGGVFPMVFDWSNGSSTQNLSNVVANSYTVTITDNYDCEVTQSITITEPTLLVTSSSGIDVTCHGGVDGEATTSPSGGTPPYNYHWSNGTINQTATNLYAGTFFVNVIDVNGCPAATSSVVITQPYQLAASITGTDVNCYGTNTGSITVSAEDGTGPFNYTWLPDVSSVNTVTNLPAGTYYVTIQDACNDDVIQNIEITQPAIFAVSILGTDVNCNNGDDGEAYVFAFGGVEPYSYLWSGGETDESISDLEADIYTVTVSDACSDQFVETVVIDEPTSLTTSISGTDVSCNGYGDGTATVYPSGGTFPYSYYWSNGTNSQIANNLYAGTFFVNVYDANDCPAATTSITIDEPNILDAEITGTDVDCHGASTGSVIVTAIDGAGPYTYNWFPNVSSLNNANDLTAGTYYVTVTDACTNEVVQSIDVVEPDALSSSISGIDVSCNGLSDGEAIAAPEGGVMPYSYNWSTGGSEVDITDLPASDYTVTITDACYDEVIENITISEPEVLTTIMESEDASCNGFGDGSATVTVSGGTSPYNYLWNIGQTNPTALGLFPGTYTVNIVDLNGCLTSNIVLINQPTAIDIELTVTDASCGFDNGEISTSISGGIAPYTYLWSEGTTTESIFGISDGNYTVTVYDNNLCYEVSDIDVSVSSIPIPICIVTVDMESGKNLIVWEKTYDQAIDFYKVYKQSYSGAYNYLASIPFDGVSICLDGTSDPQIHADKYKISVIDTCGNESELSDHHKTLHLNVSPSGVSSGYSLTWGHYEGYDFTTYRIFRGTSADDLVQIDSIAYDIGTFTYTDITALDGVSYYYQVSAVKPDGSCLGTKDVSGPYSQSVSNLEDNSFYVGINNNEEEQQAWNIYPNPFSDQTTIAFSNPNHTVYELRVTDVSGKTVMLKKDITTNKITIQRENLSPGFYLIELSGENYYKGKIVVK